MSRHCAEEGAKWSPYHKSANVPSIFQSPAPLIVSQKRKKKAGFFSLLIKNRWMTKKVCFDFESSRATIAYYLLRPFYQEKCLKLLVMYFPPFTSQRLEARFFSSLLPPPFFCSFVCIFRPCLHSFLSFFRIYGEGTRAACLSGEGGWRVEVTALSPCATEHTWAEDGLSRMESKFHKAWFALYCFRKPVACAHLCSEVNC